MWSENRIESIYDMFCLEMLWIWNAVSKKVFYEMSPHQFMSKI